MFSSDIASAKSDFYDHHYGLQTQPSKGFNNNYCPSVPSTFISPPNYSDSAIFSQTPLSIYNNYSPNFHYHHYYQNFPVDCGYHCQVPTNGNLQDNTSNWMRKYDYDNQKEYFIANTPPTPSECCDFEVPQQIQHPNVSPKPPPRIFNDIDKIFFDDQKDSNFPIAGGQSFWEQNSDSENSCGKFTGKSAKRTEKSKCEKDSLGPEKIHENGQLKF